MLNRDRNGRWGRRRGCKRAIAASPERGGGTRQQGAAENPALSGANRPRILPSALRVVPLRVPDGFEQCGREDDGEDAQQQHEQTAATLEGRREEARGRVQTQRARESTYK